MGISILCSSKMSLSPSEFNHSTKWKSLKGCTCKLSLLPQGTPKQQLENMSKELLVALLLEQVLAFLRVTNK